MGFKLGRIYVLDFEGIEAMEGAIVKVRSPSIDVSDSLPELTWDETWKLFVEYVTEWNFETEDGTPVPVTVEAIKSSMEPAVAKLLVHEWYRAARGVTAPLVRTSDAGEPPPEEESPAPSMPMEIL